jgi:hypothetical protein
MEASPAKPGRAKATTNNATLIMNIGRCTVLTNRLAAETLIHGVLRVEGWGGIGRKERKNPQRMTND